MRANAFWLVCALLVLAACVPAPIQGAPKDSPRVVAAGTILEDIAQNVVGGRLTVGSLLPPGVDPHGYQLTPQDAIMLAQSELVIINGRGYEAWMTHTEQTGDHIQLQIEASAGLGAGGDPHLWMDPLNVVRYAENIRDGLSKIDPQGVSIYTANAKAYENELRNLDEWIRTEVAAIDVERRVLVTNHHELASFAEAYGFKVLGAVIPSFTSEAAPSAQEMGALIRAITQGGSPAIFLGMGENDDLARQIAAESGARVVTGLYVETLSVMDGPASTYIEMMKYDVGLIVEALR